jgi:hypothetical protein
MRWPPLNARFVVYATVLIFAAQNFGTESVHDELVRLQEQQRLTLAWTDEKAQSLELLGRASAETPFRAILFRSHAVIPLKDSIPPVRPRGFSIREIPGRPTFELCWSHDRSRVAVVALTSDEVGLEIFDRQTKEIQAFDSPAPVRNETVYFTSQCWSPDDKNVVYVMGSSVKVHSVDGGPQSIRVIAQGSDATWSPDGQWIAFLDHGTYYAIHPDGTGKRKVFHNHWGTAVSALYWSPDSRIVAYVRELGFLQGGAFDAEVNQLRARRLADGDETTLCPDSVYPAADYQWVTSPELIKKPN